MEAMILVAHADDETLGAGGIIQKLIKRSWQVNVVILSSGVRFMAPRRRGKDNRIDAKAACTVLGVGEPKFLGFPDQKFDQVPMANLASAVSSLEMSPDLIVTHVGTDLNLDHRLTCDVAKILGRPVRKPVSILGCEIPSVTSWNGQSFSANFYVDITDEIEKKIVAFAKYQNELKPFPHPWSEKGLRLMAEYRGMQCGYRYAEAFSVIRACEKLL